MRSTWKSRRALNLPVLKSGALLAAWNQEDMDKLDGIIAQAHANGVPDVQRIECDEIKRLEPALGPALRGGVIVPREYLIDPWSAPLAYIQQAIAHGAYILRNAEVTAGAFDAKTWRLQTTQGAVVATHVINCAGLYGDRLETLLLGDASFEIRPRKGQFVVFDKAAAALLHSILLPVPGERTKGIVITRTVYGNLLVGPTAEEQPDRGHAGTDTQTLQMLVEAAIARIPALAAMPVTATYAGLRPATEQKYYRIRHEPARNWITAGGIRSTGLSSALGLAQHLFSLWQGGAGLTPPAEIIWPQLPNLAEDRARDWAGAGSWRDRLPLRNGHATRDRGRLPIAPPAGRFRRPETPHPGLHGKLPGFLLHRPARGTHPGPACGSFNRRCRMSVDYDVIIIGAGPAGLAAAVEIAPQQYRLGPGAGTRGRGRRHPPPLQPTRLMAFENTDGS